LIYCQK